MEFMDWFLGLFWFSSNYKRLKEFERLKKKREAEDDKKLIDDMSKSKKASLLLN
ncbi:hypothetical protein [Lutispora thermophila]|uniref:Uncharacterized protein n=1 Tax=Lutispora thermophila DSM 19022 TaxID=1122184 RepID=A0A1M6CYN5_9FIRM|nr:hypothetical protein [Lutispora thermophila]SHI66132.1 hypothetical protein SAMN02745176_00927 [Lutispora thermophila DSM 19022]